MPLVQQEIYLASNKGRGGWTRVIHRQVLSRALIRIQYGTNRHQRRGEALKSLIAVVLIACQAHELAALPRGDLGRAANL